MRESFVQKKESEGRGWEFFKLLKRVYGLQWAERFWDDCSILRSISLPISFDSVISPVNVCRAVANQEL